MNVCDERVGNRADVKVSRYTLNILDVASSRPSLTGRCGRGRKTGDGPARLGHSYVMEKRWLRANV